MTENTDSKGVARYPVGIMPVMDPATGETLVDELGRRSFTTSVAYGPTIGKNIALAYLPWSYCQEGRKLAVEYFGETYPVGTELRGTVARLMDKGVVVDIGNDIEGFVPLSHIPSDKPIESPADVCYETMIMDLRIVEVDPIHRRIVLGGRSMG